MSNIFEKKTGNYVRPGDPIGQHEDSLVANIQRLDPATRQRIYVGGDSTPDPSDTVAPMTDAVSTSIVQDLDRIVRGRGERIETAFVREELVRHGVDPDNLPRWPEKKRRHFHNECVRLLRRKILDRNVDQDLTRTYDMLLVAPDTDPVIWSNFTNTNETMRTTAGEVRRALGMSVEDFFALGREGRLRVIKKVSHKLRVGGASVKGRDTLRFTQERTSLHHALSSWANGELRLERPQSSSLHLMVEYDRANSMGEFARALDDTQVVVVEHDWGASVPPVDGEWRLPYPLMCWEFRISGVRVLAFTDAETTEVPQLYCVYGRDDHWVIDDFYYSVTGGATLGRGIPHRVRTDGWGGDLEFRRVATMVHSAIRAVCIMLDAQVARAEHVAASGTLVQRRVAQRKTPPRDHVVVRLFGRDHRRVHPGVKVAGRLTDARSPQRGHWRKGTWVHYDDQDSGQVQYVNEGGFIVSKTWRRWHFAGDPNNILHKELRA